MYDVIGRIHGGFEPFHRAATEGGNEGPPVDIPYDFPTIQVCPYG